MVSGEQFLVKAPNGAVYRFHRTRSGGGYVYALGHRVYGTLGQQSAFHGTGYITPFIPRGKWAFIVAAAPNAAVASHAGSGGASV